jgi:hypothetical protein
MENIITIANLVTAIVNLVTAITLYRLAKREGK